jgi:hypothetical protein
MKRVLLLAAFVVMLAPPAAAQYGQKKSSFRFTGDGLVRYEWTQKIPVPGGTVDENLYFLQARPRMEAVFGPVALGVGGLFNYSKDDNTEFENGEPRLIVRDNFFSRDARFDVYYAKVKAGPVRAEAGRMLMPMLLPEMIWDRDLRPRGGALSLVFDQAGSPSMFAIRGIYTRGSHWFEDESEMFGGSAELVIGGGQQSQFSLAGSYLYFRKLDTLDPRVRRQNTRNLAGLYVFDYRVVDIHAGIVAGGQVPFILNFDYAWNTQLSENNKGLWLQVAMGQLEISRAWLEYTYAKIDRDATVAAFNSDDFFWGTGYLAHRLDIGAATGKGRSIHGIASMQRFKDSLIPEQREEWVRRYRIEWRYSF